MSEIRVRYDRGTSDLRAGDERGTSKVRITRERAVSEVRGRRNTAARGTREQRTRREKSTSVEREGARCKGEITSEVQGRSERGSREECLENKVRVNESGTSEIE